MEVQLYYLFLIQLNKSKKMCDRVVWLEHGKMIKIGGKEICDEYKKYMESK